MALLHFEGRLHDRADNPHDPIRFPSATRTLESEEKEIDTQTGMLRGMPRSARCVQRFDDSLNSAIHTTYRSSRRSSSMREPRDPLLKVVFFRASLSSVDLQRSMGRKKRRSGSRSHGARGDESKLGGAKTHLHKFANDPSAGSPTETLLRLLVPLNDQVRSTFPHPGPVAGSQAPVRRPH